MRKYILERYSHFTIIPLVTCNCWGYVSWTHIRRTRISCNTVIRNPNVRELFSLFLNRILVTKKTCCKFPRVAHRGVEPLSPGWKPDVTTVTPMRHIVKGQSTIDNFVFTIRTYLPSQEVLFFPSKCVVLPHISSLAIIIEWLTFCIGYEARTRDFHSESVMPYQLGQPNIYAICSILLIFPHSSQSVTLKVCLPSPRSSLSSYLITYLCLCPLNNFEIISFKFISYRIFVFDAKIWKIFEITKFFANF